MSLEAPRSTGQRPYPRGPVRPTRSRRVYRAMVRMYTRLDKMRLVASVDNLTEDPDLREVDRKHELAARRKDLVVELKLVLAIDLTEIDLDNRLTEEEDEEYDDGLTEEEDEEYDDGLTEEEVAALGTELAKLVS